MKKNAHMTLSTILVSTIIERHSWGQSRNLVIVIHLKDSFLFCVLFFI